VELRPDANFRARRPDAEVALPYGAALRSLSESTGENGAVLYGDLRSTLRNRLNLGKARRAHRGVPYRYPGRTAVLCRTNGQALIVSEQMHRLGVPHRLQRSAQDRVAPIWLGCFSPLRRIRPEPVAVRRAPGIPASADDITPDGLGGSCSAPIPGGTMTGVLDLGRLRTILAVGRLRTS